MAEVITTTRLSLRRFDGRDANAIVAGINDIDVAKWLTKVPHPYTRADAVDFIDRAANSTLDAFAVEHESAVIGCISTGEDLGYWYAPKAWGRGFATEAGRAVVARHFASNDAPLPSGYHLGNDRSCNALTKLGFVPTVRRRVRSVVQGRDVEVQRMELTRGAWELAR